MNLPVQVAFDFPARSPSAWEILFAEERLLELGFRPGWMDGNGDSVLTVDNLPDEWWALTADGEAFCEDTLEELLLTAWMMEPAPRSELDLVMGFGDEDGGGGAAPVPVPTVESQGKLVALPLTLTKAKAFCKEHHSHLKPPQGGLMAVGVGDSVTGKLHCVAVIGRPVARAFNGRGIAEITRVASDGRRHASSKAIALATRLALLQGYKRVVSYTLLEEEGTSYRAANWRPVALSRGGHWGRGKRKRADAEQPGAKVRWEVGPEALDADAELEAVFRRRREDREADANPRDRGRAWEPGRPTQTPTRIP